MTEQRLTPSGETAEDFDKDLRPDPTAGQNIGLPGSEDVKEGPTAYEVKEIHRQFHGFSDEELKNVPILATGTRLKQGAVYVDLNDESLSEFKARGDQEAGPENYYVPKSEVDYQLWNRLIGNDTIPARVDEPDEE